VTVLSVWAVQSSTTTLILTDGVIVLSGMYAVVDVPGNPANEAGFSLLLTTAVFEIEYITIFAELQVLLVTTQGVRRMETMMMAVNKPVVGSHPTPTIQSDSAARQLPASIGLLLTADPCQAATTPCLNSGLCSFDNFNTQAFSCACAAGWSGTMCNQCVDSSNAACVPAPPGSSSTHSGLSQLGVGAIIGIVLAVVTPIVATAVWCYHRNRVNSKLRAAGPLTPAAVMYTIALDSVSNLGHVSALPNVTDLSG